MAQRSTPSKSKSSKGTGSNVFLTISNPQNGANVQDPSGTAASGGLCVANGQAPAPDPGFTLEKVTVYNVSGAVPASDQTIDQYGKRLTPDGNRNWSDTTGTIIANITPATNTFSARYKYRQNNSMPPVYQTKPEDVTYTTQRVATCPVFKAASAASAASATQYLDCGPYKKTGNTYLYKGLPTNQGDLGIRLMKDRRRPLHASEIQVAVVKANWTPVKENLIIAGTLLMAEELHLHRPVGAFDSIPPVPSSPFETLNFRFSSKHKYGIVLFQPSTQVVHTLMSQTAKVPDQFSLHNFVDIHVMVNDIDIPEFYADNDGTFDLWVRVLR